MLKDAKVELALMKALSEFTGMVLRNAKLKEEYVEGRDVVTAELLFSSKINPREQRTLVFALDKELTLNEHTEIVNKILDEGKEADSA